MIAAMAGLSLVDVLASVMVFRFLLLALPLMLVRTLLRPGWPVSRTFMTTGPI